ncbi:hypothetical protein OPT61_g886 [Boeremia exigua]|uniref:Uncharacterized protein n=1 Tax=Boeremia exigua TaxID=749465 RepID=A0ACC2ISB8_9PLEO|nr:hypothetical protein OPT61_g886 [Boeremia exigua]
MIRSTPGQRAEVFDINTTISDTEKTLQDSPCRFCRLLSKALDVHALVSPGRLECMHDGSSMASIQMESMVSALAVSLDDVTRSEKKFSKEYANIEKIDYDLLKADILSCEQAHKGCTPDVLGDLPGFRLIDCDTKIIVAATTIKHQLATPQQSGYHYVALSYVWGPKPDESRLNEKGALENLPRTIDDSIRLCRALGYRYLWVDRYCIDQKNAAEKAIQIANMGKIYSSAQLTIVASVGEDPSYGLPGITSIDEDVPFVYERIKDLTMILRPLSSIASIAASKWATRGWTYQEGYLSRKRIFFTNKGVHYLCNAASTNSALHRFLPRPDQRPPPSRPYSEVSAWTYRLSPLTRNLEAYSARQLSVDADALDAITGALNAQVTNEMPVYHIWGVPICETDIDFDHVSPKNLSKGRIQPGQPMSIEFLLQWHHYRPCRRRPDFPSWSFLGWAGRIFYYPWPRQIHVGEYFVIHNLKRLDQTRSPQSLEANLEVPFSLSPPGSHYLDVTMYTIQLALVNVNWRDDSVEKGYYDNGWQIAVSLQDKAEVFFPVQWSRDPSEIDPNTALLGALFISERKIEKSQTSTVVFVLEKKGDHFERVGLCIFRGSELRTVPSDLRKGARATVEEWSHRHVSMREWQSMATKNRISIG